MIKPDAEHLPIESSWSEELTELKLIPRILQGETSGYSIILARFQDSIYRMLLRQTGDSAIAADLAQETFIKAYEKLSSFRGESTFSTWLTRIALNLANNYFSSKEYKQNRKSIGPISQNISEDIAPARIEERLSLLREFISELKPKQRSVVLICGLEKKSYEEAALILKIPVGTVRSRLHEARVTLRNRFLTEASDL